MVSTAAYTRPAGILKLLLGHIGQRKVIPILGSDLLQLSIDGKQIPLQLYLARILANALFVNEPAPADPDALTTVLLEYLKKDKDGRAEVFHTIHGILSTASLQPPESLRQLARVRHFNLFVTTTFDTLLEQAIDEVRFGGKATCKSMTFAINKSDAIPSDIDSLDVPIVYHLLGKTSPNVDEHVITEEDTLEFLYALQGEKHRPESLLDQLKEKHLLLIGNSFPDWLTRFFIRLAKGQRLSVDRQCEEFLVPGVDESDKNLVLFLERFSNKTKVFPRRLNLAEFVTDLANSYELEYPPALRSGDLPSVEAKVPKGIVFLSYQREAAKIATAIADALNKGGLDVWFDVRSIEPAEPWKAAIRDGINNCNLFLALITPETKDQKGFFRVEWDWAAQQKHYFPTGRRFIVPVAVGAVEKARSDVPDEFKEANWLTLPDGVPSREFVEEIKRLYRRSQTQQGSGQ